MKFLFAFSYLIVWDIRPWDNGFLDKEKRFKWRFSKYIAVQKRNRN